MLGSSYPRLNGSLIGVTALSAGYRGVSTADDSFARRSPTTRTAASPYREDERTEYIFALTGFPVGLKWQELVALGAVETPDAKLFLYDDQQAQRADVPEIVAERPGKMLVLCDSLDQGRELATDLDAPFVHGETTDRMRMFQDPENHVVIGARVADEGLSLADLDIVVEYGFHRGSRRQEAQRYGCVMHGETEGEHLILMTDADTRSIASGCSRSKNRE